MGYYMEMRSCDFFIAKENLNHIAEAIRGMLGDVWTKGSGGCYQGGQTLSKHYSWVDNTELANADTAEKAFKAWRWEAQFDGEGNIVDLCFDGEKLGDDEQFFQTIAPWVKDGSYIEMSGEDGALWRWTFNNGEMREKTPDIRW